MVQKVPNLLKSAVTRPPVVELLLTAEAWIHSPALKAKLLL